LTAPLTYRRPCDQRPDRKMPVGSIGPPSNSFAAQDKATAIVLATESHAYHSVEGTVVTALNKMHALCRAYATCFLL